MLLNILWIILILVLVCCLWPLILGGAIVVGVFGGIVLLVLAANSPAPQAPQQVFYPAPPTSLLGQFKADNPQVSKYNDYELTRRLYNQGEHRENETFSDFATRVGVRCNPAPCR